MAFKFLAKLFDSNAKELERMAPIIASINSLESKYHQLKKKDFSAQTEEFKRQLNKGKTLDELLPQAFALVREASRRTLSLLHYDVQLMAGIAFHQGKVAEQKTGEGKTLSATLALYLNSLTGEGAHLVTVNDYLAQRDAGWMGPIFNLLGVSVGVIYSGAGDQPASIYDPDFQGPDRGDTRLEHLRPVTRQEAYAADITYGTNNEFGFDYLRDNMAQSLDRMVQRGHHYAIVDEVDSILIDEARTPLIISAPDTEPTKKYYEFAKLVDTLTKDIDYAVDEKLKTANLTDYGIRRLEKRLNVKNLYEESFDTIHHVEQALKAKTLFHRDRDYVTKDNQVIIVDEHTGRLMFGRRYSEGLHQAIEAKEGVMIQQESRTLATISLQNYFRMYQKLAGMTGTAATEAEEFKQIYDIDVVVVPTNEPVIRIDHPDAVYKTTRAKYGAIVKEISQLYEKGQPVLIGTRSIEHNQIISNYLKRKKITHNVLNAKNHEQEALIIADAGKPKAVTVATNIAGRGVDIVLGGAMPEDKSDRQALKGWQERNKEVIKLGGLHIIGSERHESRRIDNQLRGRSGRQGDPGSSRFYTSLEDDIMRLFGGEQVSRLMDMLKIPEDQPIEHAMVSKAIEQAQTKVEGFYFDQRKRVLEFDDVMNKQREIIYKRRYQILEDSQDVKSTKLKDRIIDIVNQEISHLVIARTPEGLTSEEYDAIIKEFITIIPFDTDSQKRLKEKIAKINSSEEIINFLNKIASDTYEQREQRIGSQLTREVEKFALLSSIDSLWMDHLDSMDDLREGIWLRGGKEQVLSEYKKEAFEMFESLMGSIDTEVAKRVFRIQIGQAQETTLPQQVVEEKKDILEPTPASRPEPRRQATGDFASALAASSKKTPKPQKGHYLKPVVSGQAKIGRNDPCPCGAINPKTKKPYKYKKCGLINAPHHKG